jgi:hypothetical protein
MLVRMDDATRPARRRLTLGALGICLVAALIGAACHEVTPESRVTRAPYLTAEFGDRATVNWATDRSDDEGSLHWGRSPTCRGHVTRATRTAIKVRRELQWQWRADLTKLAAGRQYCYRPFLDRTDLLGDDDSIEFRAAPAASDTSKFSFAVLGDWGQGNSAEASVLRQIGRSRARFVVTVGDNAYPSGDQNSYGDLERGAVFGRDQLPSVGQRPIFAAQGNHGFLQNLPYLQSFPSDTVARASGGRFRQDDYCCTKSMGSAHEDYASAWYAFDWGGARFYVLASAWVDEDEGYPGDFESHWAGPVSGCTICGQELSWLQRDLAAHAGTRAKFAFFHYPLHVDSSAQRSDPFTSGSDALEGLLAANGVDIAFSGHAHVYERNFPQVGGLVTYVTGGGGGALSPINSCSPFDAYALGASTSCHAAVPDTPLAVFHFLLVTVDGDAITVTPTDALGTTFDQQVFSTTR